MKCYLMYSSVMMGFAAISVTSKRRCFQQIRLSTHDLLAATALVAAICGAVATRSQIGFSLSVLIALT